MRRFWIIGWLGLTVPSDGFAMSLDEVLRSSSVHYPAILEARQTLAEQEGKMQSARGAFDWSLESRAASRIKGFYNGHYAESQLTRRLNDSAARVYGGYRISQGRFPAYEEALATPARGEFDIGVVLSLWRDRIIDEDRFARDDAALEMEQKRAELLLTRLGVQYDAMLAYLDWLAAGKALRVAEGLAGLAQSRQAGFRTRADKGDIADIALTENQQSILKRRSAAVEARRSLENKAFKLSLYWRDAAGDPVVPKPADLPDDFPAPAGPVPADLQADIERARSLRPDLAQLQLGMKRERNKMRLGENKLLPKVDLQLEGVRGVGNSDFTRRSNEAKIGVNIAIPLQRNLGEGLVRQSQARLSQIDQKQRLLSDRIAAEIETAASNYRAADQHVRLAAQEIEAAQAMEGAERERFASGAADFFVLNVREERTADARLKHIEARRHLWTAIASYYLATLQADRLLGD